MCCVVHFVCFTNQSPLSWCKYWIKGLINGDGIYRDSKEGDTPLPYYRDDESEEGRLWKYRLVVSVSVMSWLRVQVYCMWLWVSFFPTSANTKSFIIEYHEFKFIRARTFEYKHQQRPNHARQNFILTSSLSCEGAHQLKKHKNS